MITLEGFLEEWYDGGPWVSVKTSGSTGEPKQMMVEKRRMLNSARITCDFLGLKEGDTALLCMSLDYIAGKMMVVRAIERGLRLISVEPSGHPMAVTQRVIQMGHPMAVTQREHPMAVTQRGHPMAVTQMGNPMAVTQMGNPMAVTQRGQSLMCSAGFAHEGQSPCVTKGQYPCVETNLLPVDFAAMVPMQVYNSLQVPEERERLMQIRHLIIGGGAIDEAMEQELRGFPNAVWSTYGMTETLSHIALRRLNGPEASEGYTPFDSVHLSLSDEGCLIIDAPEVCPERLVTNDIAELRADGTFRILGRKDNVICSGGIKIQAEEVERLLRPHLREPYMISKRPDEKFGEIAVLLTEGNPDEAREVCQHVLTKYYQPRAYIHVNQIPMTETGKLKRRDYSPEPSHPIS